MKKNWTVTVRFPKGKETRYFVPEKETPEAAAFEVAIIWNPDFREGGYELVSITESIPTTGT